MQLASQLFDTVPADSMNFGYGDHFDPKRVADWMRFDKSEVSRIALVAKSSVRYDENIPRPVRDRLEEIAVIINMVAKVLDGDAGKTAMWFRTKNPMIGDISPRDMIRLGRSERLRKYILSAMADARKPD